MKARTRRHASSDASANSSCLRSKKLCGAPGYVTISCSMPAALNASSNDALCSEVMFWSAPAWSARIGARMSAARCETVAVRRLEHEVVVRHRRAGDDRDRRQRVAVEAHAAEPKDLADALQMLNAAGVASSRDPPHRRRPRARGAR